MRWQAETNSRDGGFVADLAGPVLTLLDPKPGERILDLGCGDGRVAARLAATGARITGIDAAPSLFTAARARACDVRLPASGTPITAACASLP